MPIITGSKPSAWIGSSSRPTQDFSFLRGGGISGGGSPDAFYESRPMGRRPKTEDEWLEEQRQKASAGEQIDLTKEPTPVDILNSEIELGVGTWTAPSLDINAVLPTLIDGGQLSVNSVKAEYINANSLSAISANLGTVTAGTINFTNGSIFAELEDAMGDIDVTYSGNRVAAVVNNVTGKTYTFTYSGNKLTSVTDATYTWTLTYSGNKLTNITRT